jgi:hypothetical protein
MFMKPVIFSRRRYHQAKQNVAYIGRVQHVMANVLKRVGATVCQSELGRPCAKKRCTWCCDKAEM